MRWATNEFGSRVRRPLDPLRSLKTKLAAVILAAVGVTLVVFTIGVRWDISTVWLGLIAGSASLVMIHFLARGMTSPLREMASAAAAMASGDYSRRVTETSRDEVGDLARAFNRMAAELAETDRIRRDLVANVSHDLRTPLSSLHATLENLIDGITQPDEKSLTAMLAQVERLGALVSQLLELSNLESGVVPFEREGVELNELIAISVRELGPDAERVDVVLPASGLRVNADPERINRVFSNLLHNALRHSPAAEQVSVTATGGSGSVIIEVADRGPGLMPGEELKVFERFYRGDSSRSTDEGGAGLGLAIARWVVELHGGSIEAQRNDPTGCRMVVTLPIERDLR